VTHDPNIAEYGEQIVSIKDGELQKNHAVKGKILWEK
jgi:ABC-type lipoprotein export system ATPase subunit